MNRIMNRMVKTLIVLGMAMGVALLAGIFVYVLPNTKTVFSLEGRPEFFTVAAGILAVLCIASGEYIGYILFQMMRSLERDPFVEKNVIALRRMGFAALFITACGLLTLLLRPAPFAVIVALPVGMCGLFSLVLSGVFSKAVAFKEENDLTV
ncbi:MAG: DUF2975 domain-containing protein [Clostridia bacterium]